MTSGDLVSVTVPAYNHERYVAACLQSIASQTHRRLELLVIDDGSSDGTNAAVTGALRTMRPRFERVVHVSRPNRGAVATLNELNDLVRGEFVYLLASDDLAKPEAIEILLGFLATHPRYGLAVGDNEIIDEHGTRVFWDRHRANVPDGPDVAFRTFGEFLRHERPDVDFGSRDFGDPHTLAWGNYVPNGKLYRRSALRAAGVYREGTLEDWDMNFRLSLVSRLGYLDRVLASYRWHGTNTIKDSARIEAMVAETERLLDPVRRAPAFRVRGKVLRTWSAARRRARHR